ncbi:rod shape-determining protein MreD [Angustibacter luteus]|uniref:Rod shape-determining protein MreD n=1 Tax=Angustibacter luteus TaxID=658456 RepID=A0ABW1JK58_9ACTN
MSAPRIVLAAGLVVLAQLLNVCVLARWSWPGATPDLTLLVVVALALLGGPASGVVAGLSAGLLVDLTPPGAGPLGLTAVAYALAGAVAGRWHRPGERSLLLPVTAAAAAALVASAVQALIPLLSGRESIGSTLTGLGASVLYAVLGALVVVPVVVLLDRLVEGDPAEAVRL